jgi:hypothetical protein
LNFKFLVSVILDLRKILNFWVFRFRFSRF